MLNDEEYELEPLLLSDQSATSNKQIVTKQKKGFPKCIFFILGNEFCERYSYYGMRTILVLYLKYYLHWDEDTATAVYHAFTVLAYLFPIFGAIVADSWWGKYNTILYLSIVYALGMILNMLGAIGTLGNTTVHAVLSSMGLLVIAFGTGGIKPCVSAFGGDQFDEDQDQYRRSFFSLFYFAINAGSLVSTFVSPIIRDEVTCFGDDCYALAFGIPAALMVIAIFSFFMGTRFYYRQPPTGNIFFEVPKAIYRALSARWNAPVKDKKHWMDYALETTDAKLVRDIKYVLRIVVLYIPLPLFWTLFDQQGSRWTLQAVRMDGYVGSLRVLPDQMQICNPLMIVTLIPLFEVTLYPCLRHFKINFTPLRRMTLGMLLAGLAFVVAALVQMMIDENLTKVPETNGQTSLRVINSARCDLSLNIDLENWALDEETGSGGGIVIGPSNFTNTKEDIIHPQPFIAMYECMDNSNKKGIVSEPLYGKEAMDLIISDNGDTLKSFYAPHHTEKSDSGKAFVRIVNAANFPINIGAQSIEVNGSLYLPEKHKGSYEIDIVVNEELANKTYTFSYEVFTGALYTYVFREDPQTKYELDKYTDVYRNDVNIFWMIPQYFIITLGEVFLSVTGLEFSYSQAPPSMKSILQSLWLLTVSIGNIIVLIVAEAKLIPNQADEYFLFAGLIGVAAILFVILSMRYEYVDESEFYEAEEDGVHLEEDGFNGGVIEDKKRKLSELSDVEIKNGGVNGVTNGGFEHNTAI
nr:solute carrier family 15 member 2-like isoform X1 [Ciona intestinalis]XP_026693216.1 solute carrier family 15 member 2-like isoform X2 [Ciona intestinalis]|eukprot:XP_018670182.1 solute carrier family 15 member 2-like isoform X1 [Ciona intestinalis]